MSVQEQEFNTCFQASISLKREEKLEEALLEFKKCIVLDQSNCKSYQEIYEVMRDLKKDYSDCLQYLLNFLDLHPDSQEILQYISKISLTLNEIENEVLIQLISGSKNEGDVYFQLGRIIFEQTSEVEKASFFLTKYLSFNQLEDISAENCLLIGKCLHEANKENAHILLQRALEIQKSLSTYQLLVENYIKNAMFLNAFKCALDEREEYPEVERPSLDVLEDFITDYLTEYNDALIKRNLPNEELHQKAHFLIENCSIFVQICEYILEIKPTKYIICQNISNLLIMEFKDIEKAEKYMKIYLFHHPNDYLMHFKLGIFFYMKSMQQEVSALDKAIECFQKVFNIYLRSVNTLEIGLGPLCYYLGEVYMHCQEYEKAIYYMKKSQLLSKQFQMLSNSNLTACYFSLKNHEKCFELIQEQYQEDMDLSYLNTYLIAIYTENKNTNLGNRVKNFLLEFTNNQKDNFQASLTLCQLFLQNSEYEQSLKFLEICENIINNQLQEIPQQHANFTNSQYLKYIRIAIIGDLQQVDEAEKQTLEIFEENQCKEVLVMLLEIYQKKGDKEKIEFYQKILYQESNEMFNLYLEKAQSYKENQFFELSIQQFELCLKADPQNFSFYYDYGYSLQAAGHFNEAIDAYSLYLQNVMADHLQCNYQLGCLYLQLNQIETAKAHFINCTTKDPSFVKAIKELVLIYKKEKNYVEAIKCLENELKENPNQLDSIIEIMDIEYQLILSQDFEKLEKYLKMAQSINTDDLRVKKYSSMLKLKQL